MKPILRISKDGKYLEVVFKKSKMQIELNPEFVNSQTENKTRLIIDILSSFNPEMFHPVIEKMGIKKVFLLNCLTRPLFAMMPEEKITKWYLSKQEYIERFFVLNPVIKKKRQIPKFLQYAVESKLLNSREIAKAANICEVKLSRVLNPENSSSFTLDEENHLRTVVSKLSAEKKAKNEKLGFLTASNLTMLAYLEFHFRISDKEFQEIESDKVQGQSGELIFTFDDGIISVSDGSKFGFEQLNEVVSKYC